MYIPTFAQLAGDEATFFAGHFNRAPLLRRAALSDDPRAMLSIADLDESLHLEAIRPPHVGVTVNGQAVPRAAYTTTTRVQGTNVTDTVVPRLVYELFRTGATITWSAAEQFSPSLRALTATLAEKFATESGATAFLTPAGRQGFSPHHDPVDLFIIQLEGTKHWRLWKTPAERKETIGHYKLDELGEPVIETTLHPGDVLYMPYNTPHVAAAEDQVSLHLSVMVRPRMWRDLLTLTVGRLLDSEMYRDGPRLDAGTLPQASVDFADRAALVMAGLAGIDAETELRRLVHLAQGREQR